MNKKWLTAEELRAKREAEWTLGQGWKNCKIDAADRVLEALDSEKEPNTQE